MVGEFLSEDKGLPFRSFSVVSTSEVNSDESEFKSAQG